MIFLIAIPAVSSRTIAIPKITLSISCVLSTREIICVSIVALQSKIVENANNREAINMIIPARKFRCLFADRLCVANFFSTL